MSGDETTDTEALEWSLAFTLWHHRNLLPTRKDQSNRLEAYRMAARRIAEHLDRSNFEIRLKEPGKSHG